MAKKYINHGVIWKKETKNGRPMLRMKAERDIKQGEWLSFFENSKGGNEKRPDFRSYDVEETEEQEELLTSEDISDDVPF